MPARTSSRHRSGGPGNWAAASRFGHLFRDESEGIDRFMRALSELEIRILDMIEPVAKAQGLEVVRVRVMGSQTPTLQIMAEKPDGTMNVQACATFSRGLNSILESEDPITGEYALEVSSPGIDRPLTREGDFAKWVGHEVKIELGTPTPEGRKRFHGSIEREDKDGVTVNLKDGGSVQLSVADMVKAHLVLTEKLIQDARKRGAAPAADVAEDEIPEGDFDEVDADEDEELDVDSLDEDGELESDDDEDFEDDEQEDEDEEASASHKKE